MPLDPPSSHGAPDVVAELRRQGKFTWAALLIALASLVVAIIALIH